MKKFCKKLLLKVKISFVEIFQFVKIGKKFSKKKKQKEETPESNAAVVPGLTATPPPGILRRPPDSSNYSLVKKPTPQIEEEDEDPENPIKMDNARKVTFFDFKGLMAPVFTCFKDDERRSLDVRNINRYAEWLKSEKINGVLVNGVTGEGPTLGVKERKAHGEYWFRAAIKYDLILMLQIGGAPLPDVLDLATHAEETGVHAVLCLPELFYKPRTVEQLVIYCKTVADKCRTRPFFYYHIPKFTGVNVDMVEFCKQAEEQIPNFFGLQFSCTDLEMGYRCLREGRVVLLGLSTLLASGLMCGFESVLMTAINMRPDLIRDVYDAFLQSDLEKVKLKQAELNRLMEIHTHRTFMENWVAAMKNWFNKEMMHRHKIGFNAGPPRKYW